MSDLHLWLRKLSMARDTKAVKMILSDAVMAITGAIAAKTCLFAENAPSDSGDVLIANQRLMQKCQQQQSPFIIERFDHHYFDNVAGHEVCVDDARLLVIPIRLDIPVGLVLCFFPAKYQPEDPTQSFDLDKCLTLTEAGAIAVEHTLLHADSAVQLTERTTELLEVQHAAETANRIKSRYLAAASHDMRLPLQQLTSLLNLLSRRDESAKLNSDIKKMLRITAGMDRLLSRLLHLEQLEQGAITPDFGPVELDSLFNTLKDDFLARANAKQLTLNITQSDLRIISDPDLLLQILRNLVGNAVKYSQQGSINIFTDYDEDFVELYIQDTGPGIADTLQPLIFDPFYQIIDSRQQPNSFGLGLSLVKALAETLSVPVLLNSEVGKGTEFKLTLPVNKQQVKELEANEDAIIQADISAKARILYLEDDEILIESFTLLLEMVGFSVQVASQLSEVNALLQNPDFNPDIVVTDKNLLNGENGLDLVAHIREVKKQPIPAILLSGYTEKRVIDEALNIVQQVLPKPIDIDVLVYEIKQLLKN